MAYDDTNRGVLFHNDRKEKDSHPDRTGSLNVDGVEYFIDAWEKTSKGGKEFLSISVKRKNNQQPRQQKEAQQRPQRTPPPSIPSRAQRDPDLDTQKKTTSHFRT